MSTIAIVGNIISIIMALLSAIRTAIRMYQYKANAWS